jgi:4'-phosphopantetheinyl transferase
VNLDGDEIHVWLAWDGELHDTALLRGYEALLAPAEHERRGRLLSERLRHQFLITRALQRTVLAGYAPGVAPRDLSFVAGPQGKPALAPEFEGLNLHFNVAHTQGLVALAVGREATLGIDVENVTARTAPLPIANRFFSSEEARDLAALPPHEQSSRFFALWTLKESWIKATGLGIAAGLGNVSFDFESDHRATRVSIMDDEARQWDFWQARPRQEHVLALALRRPSSPAGGADMTRVQMWRCVPGSSSTREPLPAAVRLGGGA